MNATMIGKNGALTDAGYAALEAAREAVATAKRHTGGREAGWFRMISRNSYTIDPARPAPDKEDEVKAALQEAAREAVQKCIDGGALSMHDATVRGWA